MDATESGPDAPTTTTDPAVREGDSRPGERRWMSLAIWAALSIAFLGYLAFGAVNARIWRFNELYVESKSIRQIWRVQGESLSSIAGGWPIQALYYGSLMVFIAGVVVGVRYLLIEAPDEVADSVQDRT